MSSYDGTNLKTVAYFGAIGVVLTIVSILAAVVICYGFENVLTAGPMYTVSTADVDRLNEEQQRKLDEFHVVDEEQGIVAIPIEKAADRLVAEVSKDPAAIRAPAEVDPDAAAETPPAGGPTEGTGPEGSE